MAPHKTLRQSAAYDTPEDPPTPNQLIMGMFVGGIALLMTSPIVIPMYFLWPRLKRFFAN